MTPTKILIVEDDSFLREIYVDTLKQAGFEVSSAEEGTEGLQKIKAGGWDLLLLDIILPQLDGIEIMKKLRADPAFEIQGKKPIIFLTNLDNDNEIKQAKLLGNGYIIKSQVNPGELVEKIKEILSKMPQV
jgi:DNA-binding response OmpR family regulator